MLDIVFEIPAFQKFLEVLFFFPISIKTFLNGNPIGEGLTALAQLIKKLLSNEIGIFGSVHPVNT